MKRLVLLIVAFGGLASANAAGDVDFKESGEFRMRYTNLMNPTSVKNVKDSSSGFTHRFRLNFAARKGETLQAYASLLHNANWGYAGGSGGTVSGVPGTPVEADEILTINRAWGWWKSTDSLSFKFGRFGLEIADGAVFSENDWEAIPVSHSGVQGTWDMDFAKFLFFGVKTDEYGYLDSGAFTADPERNFYGVSLDFKNMPEAIKMANFHVIQDVRDESSFANARNLQRFGLSVGGDTMNILYKATVAYMTGKEKDRLPTLNPSIDVNGMMYDLMVGYGLPDVMGLKVSGSYHYDSGEKATTATKKEVYDAAYYDRHNYAGLMDVLRWGNLTYWSINASLNPLETMEVGLGWYSFSRSVGDSGVTFGPSYTGTGASDYGGTTLASGKALGSEVDLYANKTYENGFKIGARYGAFMPGKALKDASPKHDQVAQELFLQAALAF